MITAEEQEKIVKWYAEENDRIFIITGYAGCGKTTKAKLIPELLGLDNVRFLTPTGKAATVLHSQATTIHSFRYTAREDDYGNLIFAKKPMEECEADILIVDEISMVNEELLKDLTELNIPMIGLGDPAQLPPVNGKNTILEKPDIFLTHVYRNDGGILDLSKDIRETGYYLLNKVYRQVEIKTMANHIESIVKDVIEDDTIVITKFNNTRRKLNRIIRKEVYGYTKSLEVGDSLMCLKNNHGIKVMNGMIFKVEAILRTVQWANSTLIKAKFEGIEQAMHLWIDKDLITGKIQQFDKGKAKVIRNGRKKDVCNPVDYAYAITCHKSQGSEFNKVVVVNEGVNIGDHQKWFYTAVTRARKALIIYD